VRLLEDYTTSGLIFGIYIRLELCPTHNSSLYRQQQAARPEILVPRTSTVIPKATTFKSTVMAGYHNHYPGSGYPDGQYSNSAGTPYYTTPQQ